MSGLIALMIEAARTSETSVDNYFTQQYIPEDKYELQNVSDFFSSFIHGISNTTLNDDFVRYKGNTWQHHAGLQRDIYISVGT
jgi:hypothetical protein